MSEEDLRAMNSKESSMLTDNLTADCVGDDEVVSDSKLLLHLSYLCESTVSRRPDPSAPVRTRPDPSWPLLVPGTGVLPAPIYSRAILSANVLSLQSLVSLHPALHLTPSTSRTPSSPALHLTPSTSRTPSNSINISRDIFTRTPSYSINIPHSSTSRTPSNSINISHSIFTRTPSNSINISRDIFTRITILFKVNANLPHPCYNVLNILYSQSSHSSSYPLLAPLSHSQSLTSLTCKLSIHFASSTKSNTLPRIGLPRIWQPFTNNLKIKLAFAFS